MVKILLPGFLLSSSDMMHPVNCGNPGCCETEKEVTLSADDVSSDDQYDLCSSQAEKLFANNSYNKAMGCVKQESLEVPNSQAGDVDGRNSEAQSDSKRRKNIFRAGKRGRPSGTTKAAGYRTSTGRPLGTTKAAGFKTSPGRPLGTTKAAGYRVSPGRPPVFNRQKQDRRRTQQPELSTVLKASS
ncbi:UPF0461 protein C5orf24 homolog isoform X2 [Callorhinchus milii]|uniref:UPF0461 protein C5orf24 homolog isoform X2 n=1 Tax=Callorhinchus milii TaxID=7868 RepID=UPI001C3F96AF|nr:UPF0461 protein C5orf24 homolog isoform X2 [Callorhinchus milii]